MAGEQPVLELEMLEQDLCLGWFVKYHVGIAFIIVCGVFKCTGFVYTPYSFCLTLRLRIITATKAKYDDEHPPILFHVTIH